MKTYWISFASGEGNLGCCIVDAEDEKQALYKTKNLGINPGGEAMFFEIPQDCIDIATFGKGVLITKDQLMANDYKSIKDLDSKQQLEVDNDPNITIVCEDCNPKKK